MKVLVIGAGAVGQVYGRHLALGGADVSFFVKPKYETAARAGYTMYPLNKAKDPDPVTFTNFGVITEYSALDDIHWDQVWICTSSTGLRAGWLPDVTTRIGDAVLVCMTPGPEDRDYVLEYVPAERLVTGLITMISYQTPLAGETRPRPGMAYWFPPLAANAFSGPRAHEAADALRAGSCPAKVDDNAVAASRFGSAVLMPHLAALEASDWKLANLRRCDRLKMASNASREAVRIVADYLDTKAPLGFAAVRPTSMWAVLILAPLLVPLPLETYLEYHFTKVGDQTRALMDTYLRLGRSKSLPTASIEMLSADLR